MPQVTLGILASRSDLSAALDLAEHQGPSLLETIVLLDAPTVPVGPLPPHTRLLARPLAGNFGAQRTALQRQARAEWVLQLDTDETLGPGTRQRLGGFVAAAARDGVLALGLPRRNFVGGLLSDHYPDPQYRLCRRTVRYEGQVHERPRLLNRARHARLALGLHIDHALDAARVHRRTQTYGAMSDGATDTARAGDERALLTPFRR